MIRSIIVGLVKGVALGVIVVGVFALVGAAIGFLGGLGIGGMLVTLLLIFGFAGVMAEITGGSSSPHGPG